MMSVTGTYEHNMDAKGRLFVPAKLRELLGEKSYLTMGMDQCLAVYPQESWEKFTAKFEALPSSVSKKMRPLFANTVSCEPDSQGRVVIPPALREYAGLSKEVMIVGVHDRAEIWDAARWRESQAATTPEDMSALMEELGF